MAVPRVEAGLEPQAEMLSARGAAGLGGLLGISYEKLSRDEVVATLEVDSRLHQPFGILHGGASVALAESVASVAGWCNVDFQSEHVVGIEINANHLHSVQSGTIRATAKPLHRGKRTQVWSIELTDDGGRLICISRCTLAVVSR